MDLCDGRMDVSAIFLLCAGWRLDTHLYLQMYVNFIVI